MMLMLEQLLPRSGANPMLDVARGLVDEEAVDVDAWLGWSGCTIAL